jgi:hypothetical protein
MAKANVTIIEAPMGEGKTITVTGIVVDDYLAHVTGVWSPSGNFFKARSYKGEWIEIFPPDELLNPVENKQLVGIDGNPINSGIQPQLINPTKHYDVPVSKIIHADSSKGWFIESDTKIFANYHLFGIRYVYCDAAMMLDQLNSSTISHCKMIIDESYIQGEARRGMNSLSLMYTWFAQQMRKRDIELFLLVQHGRFIDWRFRYIAKRKILSRYNDKTRIVRLLVQNLSKGTEKPFSYWGPQYWKYYDTNELPPMPQDMINRARKNT